ncbi:Ig-like domain (group 2) [Lachnospiraceae bacterium]|nr:Ig-like domain (group 2) [Lachnospiraceae bacterium]
MTNSRVILKRALAYVLVFALAFTTAFTSTGFQSNAAAKKVTSIKVAKTKVSVQVGKTSSVKVTVKGTKGATKFTAKSSKKSVATVKVSGKKVKITGKKKGKATITVTTKYKNKKGKKLKKKIKVTVKAAPVTPTAAPSTAPTTAPTTAPVVPTATAAPVVPTATAAPTATPEPKPEVKVKSITVNLDSDSVLAGKTTKATAVIEPENATNKDIVWDSSEKGVATIDENGEITAVGEGTTIISAIAADGSQIKGEARLTVSAAATIKLNKTSATLVPNGTLQLNTASLIPSDSTVKYSSNKTTVAEVQEATGLVTAKSVGTATITAETNYGATATCVITVASDDTVMISAFSGLSQAGTFTVKVAMQDEDNKVTEAQLVGTKLVIKNTTTGATIEATYVENSYSESDGTAIYAFDSTLIKSGSYSLVSPDPSKVAIDAKDDDDLTIAVKVSELQMGIVGYIYDYYGEPVADASVAVLAGDVVNKTTNTDSQGRYEFEVEKNTGYTIRATKEGYFTTETTGIAVATNRITSCNMFMEFIDDESLAIAGQVKVFDASSEIQVDTVIRPRATLFVKDVDEWKYVADVEVSKEGYYAFGNYYADDVLWYSDKYLLPDDSHKFTPSNTFLFSYADGISREKTYKVEITKGFDEDMWGYAQNVTAVYNPISSEFGLSTTSKVTDVKTLTLKNVAKFKGLGIEAGQMTWGSEDTKPAVSPVKVYYDLYTIDGIQVASGNVDVELNDTFNASKEDVTLIPESDALTLPEGSYYISIRTSANAGVLRDVTIDDKGTAVTLDNVVFNPAVDYELNIKIAKSGKFYNEGLYGGAYSVGDTIQLMDLTKNTTSSNAYLGVSLYQLDGNSEIYMGYDYIDDFEVVTTSSSAIEVSTLVTLSGLVPDKKYRLYFDSPVLSLTDTEGKYGSESLGVNENGEYYEFTYKGENVNNVKPEFKAQANISNIELSTNAQFEKFDSSKPLFVNYVKLLDKNKNELRTVNINRYYSCHNYSSLSSSDKNLVNSPIYGGKDIIDDGIPVGFGNIDDGTYYLQLGINKYQALTVPLNAGIDLIGLEEGTYVVASENEFKLVPEITIEGLLTYNDDAITTPIDVVALDSKGLIAGAAVSDTATGRYAIVNGTNAILNENEVYTLVFRSESVPGYRTQAVTSEKLQRGSNTKDVEFAAGSGTIEATIHEAGTTNTLINDSDAPTPLFVYAHDDRFVEPIITNVVDEDATILTACLSLSNFGLYTMSKSGNNAAYWSVDAPLANNYTVVVTGSRYEETSAEAGALASSGGVISVDDMQVPLANTIATTPVDVKVTKLNSGSDLNAGGFDIMKVYSVDAAGNETLYDTVAELSSKSYTFDRIYLPTGTYKVYVYSQGYYVGTVNTTTFVISEISTNVMTQDVTLSQAVRQ